MIQENQKIEDDAITGELMATDGEDLAVNKAHDIARIEKTERPSSQRHVLLYLILPAIFLTVAMLGGLRLASADGSLIFLRPPLIALVFAVIALVLFFRSGLIRREGWFAEDFTTLENASSVGIMLTLFAATTQLFNSLLPEQGLAFWIIGFCFFWTLWNNLFADFDTKRLLRSLGALFGLAFVVKYLLLANLTAPEGQSWFQRIIENPGQEAATWLLDLPRFSPGTGYIQFFTAVLFLLGLYLLPPFVRRSR